ncbi:hypothetical protein [Streptomyces sp. NPDC005336]|uniref:hypothetical protein n=1 Tax=unclassified Streptomyces TaxID=2593676 RepID=UPI0033AA44E2
MTPNKVTDGDTDVMRAKLSTLELLGYSPECLEDIVVTLDSEYHVIRPLSRRTRQGVFLYLVADRVARGPGRRPGKDARGRTPPRRVMRPVRAARVTTAAGRGAG